MLFLRKSTKVIVVLFCCSVVANLAEAELLTLDRVLELARNNSPLLNAAEKQVEADQKSLLAAGLWDNPELEFEAEDVGGDKDRLEQATYTAGLKQTIPLGWKGKKERAVAQQVIEMSNSILGQKMLDLNESVAQVFIELMALQEIGKIRSEQEKLGREFLEVAKRRFEAGSGSELEVTQADLELNEIILSRISSLGDLNVAKENLASLLNVTSEELSEVDMSFYELESVDALTLDDDFPELVKLDAEVEKLNAQARLAKAGDVPDITIGAGIRHEYENEIDSYVFSASIPLPFNRRGKKQYTADMLQASAVQADREEARRELERELKGLKMIYSGMQSQVDLIKSQLVPNAKKAYELSRKGYEAGRFSWMELIVAQKNLAEINIGYVENLREAHLVYAKLIKFDKEWRK